MASLQNSLITPYRTYGIQHFLDKYRIPPESIDLVEIQTSQLDNHIVSWINTGYGEIPLFEDLKGKEYIEESNGKIKINFDIYSAVGYILSGHLEQLSLDDKKKISKIPFLDIYEQILFDAITDASMRKGKIIKQQPFWPEGKKFAVCLTHDIDEVKKSYQYFTQAFGKLKKGKIIDSAKQMQYFISDKVSGKDPYWTFEHMMELEDGLGVRSSSYFLQEDGKVEILKPDTWRHHGRRYKFNNPRISRVMNIMSAGGWEVGLHGSYYSFDNQEKLGKEKTELEKVTGSKTVGIRQHNLNLKIPETWQIQENIGLEYDTTLGRNQYPAFRWATCFPFNPLDTKTNKTLSINEIPMIIEDIAIMRESDPMKTATEIVEAVERTGGVLTLLWHHSVLNEREFPGWEKVYTKIIQLCQQKNAWIVTGEKINTYWRNR